MSGFNWTVMLTLCCLSLVEDSEAKSKYQLYNAECNVPYQQKTDRAVAKLLGFGPHGRLFPENKRQLKAYCKETTQLVNHIETFFSKCYKKEVGDMARVLVYSIKSNVRAFCRRKSKKLDQLMQGTPCLNRHLIQDVSCIDLYTNNTKQLIPLRVDDQTKIRHACCYYVTSMRCIDERMESVSCIRNKKELMLDFVRGIFGSFVDFMCNDYNEQSTRCDELGPAPKPKTPNKKPYQTFLFVLLDLLESFRNFELPK